MLMLVTGHVFWRRHACNSGMLKIKLNDHSDAESLKAAIDHVGRA